MKKLTGWLMEKSSKDTTVPTRSDPDAAPTIRLADLLATAADPCLSLLNEHGVLRSTKGLPDAKRVDFSLYLAYRERAEIALHVAHLWRGGDYFEFGSDSMATFRNFLSAFDIAGKGQGFPDTRFYAFDVFGEIDDSIKNRSEAERLYFEEYRDVAGGSKMREALSFLRNHDLFVERCRIRQGLFEDTLNAEFKNGYRAENRFIGLAFLDCNIAPSYKTCFDFIVDFVQHGTYIYMDEYYRTQGVPALFDRFCERLRAEKGIRSLFVRNAGAFGALFCLADIVH